MDSATTDNVRSIVVLPLSLAAGVIAGFAFFREPVLRPSAGTALRASETEVDEPAGVDDTGTTDAKAQKLVAAALRKGDRLARQEELYLAIEALTADDFHRLATDAGALQALGKKLREVDQETTSALASGVIARWLKVDPSMVMTAGPQILDLFPKNQPARNAVLDALAKKQPAELLALVATRQDAGERAEIITRALRELAIRDLSQARAWLAQCSDPADRRTAEKAVRAGTVQADPLRAVELAASIQDRNEGAELLQAAAQRAARIGIGTLRALATTPMEPWMTRAMLAEVALRDPDLAMDLALKPGTAVNPAVLQPGFSALARRDPAQAIARTEGLSGPQLTIAIATIGAVWSQQDPAAALTWLAGRTPEERTIQGASANENADILVYAYGNWAKSAPAEARAWADALPASATRDAIQTQLAQVLAAQGQPAEAAQLLARLGSTANPMVFASIASVWAARDPQAAADWAVAQPPGPTQNRALASIVGRWAGDDPQSAGDWLAQFPAGEARDRSVAAFLSRNFAWLATPAERDGEFDAWLSLIDDPWQRAQAAAQSYWDRAARDPAGARAWFSSLPNLDPAVVRMTLLDSPR